MKKSKFAFLTIGLCAAVFACAETVAYIATAKNTPQTGWLGRVESVMFNSTNATGTATLNAVTDLLIDGKVVPCTNTIATATLANGQAVVTPTNVFVAAGQRIVVSGTAFPGGSATVWIRK